MSDTRIMLCFDYEHNDCDPPLTESHITEQTMRAFWDELKTSQELTFSLTLDRISSNAVSQAALVLDNALEVNNNPLWLKMSRSRIADFLENCAQDESRGNERLAKFIARKFKAEHDHKIAPQIKSELGNLLGQRNIQKLDIRISLGCDGSAEDYYARNSCFWGEESASRDYIEASGGGALRAYNESGGIVGRCWFVPYTDANLINGAVLFNFYGDDGLNSCSVWGDVASEVLNADAQITGCDLVAYGDYGVYQNSSYTVFIGAVPNPVLKVYMDVCLTTPSTFEYRNNTGARCHNCGYRGHEDEMYWSHWDDDDICETCRYDHYSEISNGPNAGNVYPNRYVVEVQYGRTWRTYYHQDDEIIEIDGEYYHMDNTVVDEHGTWYPSDSDEWVQCEDSTIYPREDCTLDEDGEWHHD